MRLFQYLLATSAVTTYPAFLAQKTDVNSLGKKGESKTSKDREYKVPWICDDDNSCPAGSSCYKLYGTTGICVVTLPK